MKTLWVEIQRGLDAVSPPRGRQHWAASCQFHMHKALRHTGRPASLWPMYSQAMHGTIDLRSPE